MPARAGIAGPRSCPRSTRRSSSTSRPTAAGRSPRSPRRGASARRPAAPGRRASSCGASSVADALAALTEVDYVVITAGRYDILIEAVAEDNEALLTFLNDRLQRIDGVRDTETFTYLRLVKQTYQFGTR